MGQGELFLGEAVEDELSLITPDIQLLFRWGGVDSHLGIMVQVPFGPFLIKMPSDSGPATVESVGLPHIDLVGR